MATFTSVLSAQKQSNNKEDKLEQAKMSKGIADELKTQTGLLDSLLGVEKLENKENKKLQKSLSGLGDFAKNAGSSILGAGKGLLGGAGGMISGLMGNKLVMGLGLGALGLAFKDQIGSALKGLAEGLGLSFEGIGKSLDTTFKGLSESLGISFEDLGQNMDEFFSNMVTFVDEVILEPLKQWFIDNWPAIKEGIKEGFIAGGQFLHEKIIEWFGVDLVQWWDDWSSAIGTALGLAVGTIFGPGFAVRILARAFPLLALAASLGAGIIDGMEEWKESGDIKEAIIQGLGGVLSFLTFGLLDAETVRPLVDEIDRIFVRPIVEFFEDIAMGIQKALYSVKEWLNGIAEYIPGFDGFDKTEMQKEKDEILAYDIRKEQRNIQKSRDRISSLNEMMNDPSTNEGMKKDIQAQIQKQESDISRSQSIIQEKTDQMSVSMDQYDQRVIDEETQEKIDDIDKKIATQKFLIEKEDVILQGSGSDAMKRMAMGRKNQYLNKIDDLEAEKKKLQGPVAAPVGRPVSSYTNYGDFGEAPVNTSSVEVSQMSADNEEMKRTPSGETTIVTDARTNTMVNNNKVGNVILPTRNEDSSFRRLSDQRNRFAYR